MMQTLYSPSKFIVSVNLIKYLNSSQTLKQILVFILDNT